jgi:hypothetical protein
MRNRQKANCSKEYAHKAIKRVAGVGYPIKKKAYCVRKFEGDVDNLF